MTEIKLITKEDFPNLNYRKLDWDVVINQIPYQVIRVNGFVHTIGGHLDWGDGNNLWAYPLNEEMTFDNLVEFNGEPGACWGIEYTPTNYIKCKWDEAEIRQGRKLIITRNGVPFYDGMMTFHQAIAYVKDGIPLVNPANIVNGTIVPSTKMMVSEDTRIRLNSYILHCGMIVMGRRGEMGRCAVVTENESGWLCGTGSFFMEPAECLIVEYICRIFLTPYAKHYLGGESIGTTMSNLNHTILRKMPIPLPPLAEQKRIVTRLEELLPLCESLK